MDASAMQTHENTGRPILVVENDEDTVATLRMLLEDEGYTSVSAGDTVNAIASLEQLDPGLVLLDWSLDDGSGEEVLSAAQKRTSTRTPVVLMTGNSSFARGSSGPAAAVLRKPFDVNELLRVVARYYQP
jgi:DNA-binding response OmpR family regulator